MVWRTLQIAMYVSTLFLGGGQGFDLSQSLTIFERLCIN